MRADRTRATPPSENHNWRIQVKRHKRTHEIHDARSHHSRKVFKHGWYDGWLDPVIGWVGDAMRNDIKRKRVPREENDEIITCLDAPN